MRNKQICRHRGRVYWAWHKQVRYLESLDRYPFPSGDSFPHPDKRWERTKHSPDTGLTGLLRNSPGVHAVGYTGWSLCLSASRGWTQRVSHVTPRGLKWPLVSCWTLIFNNFQHIYPHSTPPMLQRKDYDPSLHTAEHVGHFEGVTLLFILERASQA